MNAKALRALEDRNYISRFSWLVYTKPQGGKVLRLRPQSLGRLAESKLSTTDLVFDLEGDLVGRYPGLPEGLLEAIRQDLTAEIRRLRREKASPKAVVLKVCPICRSEFEPTHGRQIYCKPRCQKKAARMGKEAVKRRLQSDSFMRRCQAPGCKKSLAGRTVRAMFCSQACGERARYWRSRDRSKS